MMQVWQICVSIKEKRKNLSFFSMSLQKKLKIKNHMGKIASSDLQLNGNFIFGNWGQLGRFLFQLTELLKVLVPYNAIRVVFPDKAWHWRGRESNP